VYGYSGAISKNDEPSVVTCFYCGGKMEKKDRIETARFVRVLWHCTNPKCASDYWKVYGEITLESKRDRKRWH
jgi:aspartate carbamoyltransferase regulatory subunit